MRVLLPESFVIDREAREIIRLVASVRPSVHPSIRPSVHPSVCQSVRLSVNALTAESPMKHK